MAKRMVNDAEEVNKLTDYVRQEGNKTIIGGNLTVDGNLTVNGTAPGGGLHLYILTDGGEVAMKDFMIPIVCSTAGLTVPTMLIDQVYADYGESTLRLPAMGRTAGNGYVVGMVMTSDDKANGSFSIYTTTGDSAIVETYKCGIKMVY